MENELAFFEQLTWRRCESVAHESVEIILEQSALYPELNPGKCALLASIFRAYPQVNMMQLRQVASILES